MRFASTRQLVRFMDQMLEPDSMRIDKDRSMTLIWEGGHGRTRKKQVEALFPGVHVIAAGTERGLSFVVVKL